MNENLESTTYCPQKVIFSDASTASRRAAEIVAGQLRANPRLVLGLATGSTPMEMYCQLIEMHRHEGLDFSAAKSFNLDEYIGLGGDHPQSFRAFMQSHLFESINMNPRHAWVPDGLAKDPVAHAAEYEQQIQAVGGIDLQILGIGHNGHIAFNEPGSPADSRTRVVNLTADTIENNSRFFASRWQVPQTALSMGIGTILEAKQILLLAFGEGKADAVARALHGPVTEDHPASLLRLHPNVTFVLDEAAAGRSPVT